MPLGLFLNTQQQFSRVVWDVLPMKLKLALRSVPAAFVGCLLCCAQAMADPPMHPLNGGVLVPGATGAAQLQRGGPLAGYFQPLEIRAPQGAAISVAVENQFTQPQSAPLKVAMLVGPVYRLRVTGIPGREGDEVYPTIEVINRLYPPCGEELRFPIPIQLTQNDLEEAIDGKFITRIIYLENPRNAYARGEDPKNQFTLEASPKEDPLVMADRLGRPMAIVRIGGRIPVDVANPDEVFMYHSPPLLRFTRPISPIGPPPVESRNESPQTQPIEPLLGSQMGPAISR
jgi:hypothetical protein